LGILAILALVGGFLMVASIGYSTSGLMIIQSSKTQQFYFGLILFLAGLIGISFVIRFFAVFGKYSIFRPHTPRPTNQLQNTKCR
jgi:energy-converting hydrogenase Eha subunit H